MVMLRFLALQSFPFIIRLVIRCKRNAGGKITLQPLNFPEARFWTASDRQIPFLVSDSLTLFPGRHSRLKLILPRLTHLDMGSCVSVE